MTKAEKRQGVAVEKLQAAHLAWQEWKLAKCREDKCELDAGTGAEFLKWVAEYFS